MHANRSISPQINLTTGALLEGVDLGLNNGRATFDCRQDGVWSAPRTVVEMIWYSEQSATNNTHDHIVLKLLDIVRGGEVWIRFKPYSGGSVIGDVSFTATSIIPPNSSLRANINFVNGLEYQAVLEVREKMSRLFQTPVDNKHRPFRTAAFAEMLSLCIGQGVGMCSPQDLCEIWPSMPDSDRRLFGFKWYELADGSGVEYLVLHLEGTSDFMATGNWWVRLERREMMDQVAISGNQNMVIHAGSTLKHEMTFETGVHFEKVISVLRSVPIGFNTISEDCWFYASTIAHKLSMEAGDDLCECRAEDLCEIWSGERGSQMLVNRIQCFQESMESPPEYLLLNISMSKYDGRGLWVRLGKTAQLGQDEGYALISRNRRRLIGRESIMLADIAFEALKFGGIVAALKQTNRPKGRALAMTIRNPYLVRPVEVVRAVTGSQRFHFWVEGAMNLLDAFGH
ncbi:hypothetical protein CTheo_2369 [Ceratobasidium theobromae]|uniref:Uncharacterized protein n=1 Tax=Ceratobasidium theobromae TaxID=1582974 RepID=A0A5N5QRG3_9AGAM|nr:hypothetical protein CTheo_2369 [Ceratobasidium theobromae]